MANNLAVNLEYMDLSFEYPEEYNPSDSNAENFIEILKKIRENNFPSEVIMVTAANDSNTIEETMHLGVIDYLIKPFAFERFQVALEKFIAHHTTLSKNNVLDQSGIDNMIFNSCKTKKMGNLFNYQ